MGFTQSAVEDMEIKLKNKNILVTGGTGFIGSHLIEELIKNQVNVYTTFQEVIPYSYFFSQNLDTKTVMIDADVSDFDKMFDIVTKFKIDYVFHLAAQSLVEVAYHNPKKTFSSNILGTINILECARLYPKIKGVIIASSDKAYGKLNGGQYKESDPLRGDHPYEVSKSCADLIAHSYYKTYGLPVVTTRFGNVYGEGDLNFCRLIPGIMRAIIRDETLEIRSNGKYVRDYLYVKDVVNGYLLILKNLDNAVGEAFNFGSKDNLSVIDLISLVEDVLNKKIKYKILNTAKNEIPYQSLDFSKIKNRLSWKPNHSISRIIKLVYKWYQQYFTELQKFA